MDVKMRYAILAAAVAASGTLMAELDFRKPEIVPIPVEMSYEANQPVRLASPLRIEVSCPETGADAWVRDHVKAWFGCSLDVTQANVAGDGAKGDEGYTLSVRPDRIAIGANTLRGVRYAVMTLRQAAERESAGRTLKGYWLPALEVKDAPTLGFRGVHLCWFPELTATAIEHQIRLAAYYKYNYVVLESWGVFKGEKFPQLALRDAPLTIREARRLCAIANDLGLTLIPQVNIFGHASGARSMGGKHVTLDFHPEMQPLFEPAGGWNWCLSNPDARATVRELVAEMHEAFGNPPYFHIGCDEADLPSCPTCRAVKPYAKLVGDHIKDIAGLLRKRGARAMMWHDMLLAKDDSRWRDALGKTLFYAHGNADEAKLAEELPRDIVICDWYYGSNYGRKTDPGSFPTLDHFRKLGYSTVTCPWDDIKAIGLQGEYARKTGLFGVLETVWHHFRGLHFGQMIEAGANAGWNGGAREAGAWSTPAPFVTHWRQTGWDMGITAFSETGFYDTTVTRGALDR